MSESQTQIPAASGGEQHLSNVAKELFYDICDLPPEQRADFINTRTAGNPALRAAIESLISAHDLAGAFLSGPTLAPGSAPTNADANADSRPRRVIGPYKLLQVIGEGGFGTVYLAEQEQPVRRRVALKLIKAGMDTKQVIARFEAERQALAMMDHPNIARVYDAGATDMGRPYFVMELVRGVPITEYCDQAQLTPQQRLELFVPVCNAVQHAHQKGIIHRDLKPTNVLVTLHDGKPVPKVIDFGIAKATQQRLTERTVFTEFRQMVGTPEYMSPEQAEMSGLDIDTRSDVYSLGVILYELLTGATPFDGRDLRSKAYEEMQRVIREVDPPRPSTRLSTLETLPAVAAHRRTEPRKLSAIMRGELDWIVMRCLEKDRTRRYESPSALAADVQRYLADEPVSASPPSAVYRTGKLIRRHKLALAVTSAMFLALLAGLLVALWGLRKARVERDSAVAARKAEAESREYEAQTDQFLTSMFSSIEPDQARGKQVLVRDILDQATERINKTPPTHPQVEASLRYTFGAAYRALGLIDEAKRQLQRAADLERANRGTNSRGTANALHELGNTLSMAGEHDKAETALREAVQIYQQVAGGDDANTFSAQSDLGDLLLRRGKVDEADQLLTPLLPRVQKIFGPNSQDAIIFTATLAALRDQQGRYDDEENLLRDALSASRGSVGTDHPTTLGLMSNLGNELRTRGKLDESIPMLTEARAVSQRVFGPDHPNTLVVANNLALALQVGGRFDESMAVYQDTIARRRKLLGDDHPSTLLARSNYGLLLQSMKRVDEAEATFRDVTARMTRVLGPDHPDTLAAENNIGWLKVQTGDLAAAETIFRSLVPRAERAYGEVSPAAVSLKMRLGHVLLVQEKWPEAEPLLAQAYRGAQKLGLANQQAAYASAYGICLVHVNRPKEALPLLSSADEIMARTAIADPNAKMHIARAAEQAATLLNDPAEAQRWRARITSLQHDAASATQPTSRPTTPAAGELPKA